MEAERAVLFLTATSPALAGLHNSPAKAQNRVQGHLPGIGGTEREPSPEEPEPLLSPRRAASPSAQLLSTARPPHHTPPPAPKRAARPLRRKISKRFSVQVWVFFFPLLFLPFSPDKTWAGRRIESCPWRKRGGAAMPSHARSCCSDAGLSVR